MQKGRITHVKITYFLVFSDICNTSNTVDLQEFLSSQTFSDILEPDVVVKRQEALAAARLKMQEELNTQVEKHKEKLRKV